MPLDYDHPRGTQIALSLLRLPATDPAHRIGSLLVNPGGPGGSGVDFVREAGAYFPAEVRARFDIVGFDPRGIHRSTPLLCFDSYDDAMAVLPAAPYPETRAEEQKQRISDDKLAVARPARRRHPRPHVQRRRGPRHGPDAPAPGRPEADLPGLLVRLPAGAELRQRSPSATTT